MNKIMLINAIEPEESRIAILEDNVLEELYIERSSRLQTAGNIYKGKVINVEPSINAAFVDISLKKNGFLYVSDVAIGLDLKNVQEREDSDIALQISTGNISSLLRPGQEIIVQITKEGIGDKGPSLTTRISLPGRYLVLMPNSHRHGVSRKIVDENERKRLKKIVEGLDIPPDTGVIIRTAGADQTKRELNRDLQYLLKLWNVVSKKIKEEGAPSIIYQESDLIIRTIRDIFSADINEIIIDSQEIYKRAKYFLRQIIPKYEKIVKLYKESEPLFHKFDIEKEIQKIGYKEIKLLGGGSIIIEQTEALVAIDVNSGSFKEGTDPEETAYKINRIAAKEIARQIRLRDVGGEIVIDFIDMKKEDYIRKIEKELSEALKRDRARVKLSKMSKFCITEMTRQRIRSNIREVLYQSCQCCSGAGLVKTIESLSLDIIRIIRYALNLKDVQRIEIYANVGAVRYLQNQKRKELAKMEETSGKKILIKRYEGIENDTIKVKYFSSNGKIVKL